MKLSVIVPIYNVEKYLPRCLDSLLRQGLVAGEWEVICVNDGSPDGCGAILADYETKHPEIFKVITQKNQGVGVARNTALKVAKGKYIGFVDPDDFLINNAFRYLLDNFCEGYEGEGMVDLLHYRYSDVYTDGKDVHVPDALPDGTITFDGDGAEAYNYDPMICLWTKFYRRTFLMEHNIWFKDVRISSDELFDFDVFSHHPHLLKVSSNVYRYENGNMNSIQKLVKKETVLVQLDELLYDIKYVNKYLEEGGTCIAPAARKTINRILGTFHRKMTSIWLSLKEWNYFCKKLDAFPLYQTGLSGERDLCKCCLVRAKQWTAKSYLFYVLFTFVRSSIWVKFIRPHIVK